MAEGDTFAISALVRKRAELAGLVDHARAELDALTANLGHLDATLRLFDPGCGFRFNPAGYSGLKPATVPE
jgi:hypothetical protein